MSAVTSGMQRPIIGSAKRKLAARNAPVIQGPKSISAIQPLQIAKTLNGELSLPQVSSGAGAQLVCTALQPD